jgi:crotonobetainyl-CoA:carnitine CoA-transferase CaiB-like acyl-CoA transferase
VEDPRFATNRERHAHRHELIPILEAILATRTGEDWLRVLRAEGIPSGPIQTVDRVLSDPQVRHRGMVAEVEHPACGRIPVVGNPVKIFPAAGETFQPPPALGEHTEDVLRRAGYTAAEIESLRQEKII